MFEWFFAVDPSSSATAGARAPSTVLEFMMQQERYRTQRRVFMFVCGACLALYSFYAAITNQAALIEIMNQTIRTENPLVYTNAAVMGHLLDPTRLALVAEYPALYWVLGYSHPYTGPILTMMMQPQYETSPEKMALALALLEGGLEVDTSKTDPPTIFNELVRQLYPQDIFVSPSAANINKPIIERTMFEKVMSGVQAAMPFLSTALMVVPMFL